MKYLAGWAGMATGLVIWKPDVGLPLVAVAFVIWLITHIWRHTHPGRTTISPRVAEESRRLVAKAERRAVVEFVNEPGPYDAAHRALRARTDPIVQQGLARCMERICVMPNRWIAPGTPWHLAHDHRADRPDVYLGPAHAACNLAERTTR